MELITVDSEVFKQLDMKISAIADFIYRSVKQEEEDHLVDSFEICTYLKISSKTLQRLRNKGAINFITIGRKHLYKLSEVKRLLEVNLIRSNPENFADLLHNHKALKKQTKSNPKK